ncbi:MAG: hypothetical protein HKN30_06895 [Sulfitobacter sp.]|nr:hypothetical protein [Sulfitobacter sp.]
MCQEGGGYDHVTVPPGEDVRVRASDGGEGIPADKLQKIFEPFYTTMNPGSGLGLSTVYGIIKQFKGFVLVEACLGTGTSSYLFLPTVQSSHWIVDDPLPPHQRIVEGVFRQVLVTIFGHQHLFLQLDGEIPPLR